MKFIQKIKPYLARDEKLCEAFFGRAVFGGILGVILTVKNTINIPSLFDSFFQPYRINFNAMSIPILILAFTILIMPGFGKKNRITPKLSKWLSQILSKLASWCCRKLLKVWVPDFSGVCMVLFGVSLGAMLTSIVSRP